MSGAIEADTPMNPTDTDGPAGNMATASAGYRRYALGLLTLTLVLSLIDRQVINVLAESIRTSLHLKDWQIGLLSGLAFALFYVPFGFPLARLAERKNRPIIIATSLTIWSVFTAAGGLARNFTQLLLTRTGVAIGEAGCLPPAHALISDYFPANRRATALSIFHLGIPIGLLLGLSLGGVLADTYGWRGALMFIGLPGVVVAIITFLTLKEPDSSRRWRPKQAVQGVGSLGDTLRYLRSKPSFWFVCFAAAVQCFIGYAHGPFGFMFFLRAHGPELTAVAARFGLKPAGFLGIVMGLLTGAGAGVGTLLGGILSDHLALRDVRAYCTLPAIGSLISMPLTAAVYLAPSLPVALGLYGLTTLSASTWLGPVYAVEQGVATPKMRATAAAIVLFVLNLIGLGLGPLCVGILSDTLAIRVGLGATEGVRWALVLSAFLYFLEFALFWMARKSIRADMWRPESSGE